MIKEALVVSQECLGEHIYSLWLKEEEIANQAKAGQFLSVYSKDSGKLLPRPISICRIHQEEGMLRLVYRVTGENTGTKEFSMWKAGDTCKIMGPLGNGFELKGKCPILVGGGIGIPPMVQLGAEYVKMGIRPTFVAGYQNTTFLEEEMKELGDLIITTDMGTKGVHGTVLDGIKEKQVKGDVLIACGPMPMLKGLKAYTMEEGIPCYISMEEKMACGIGACLACVCKSKEIDSHSHVHNKRICKDGPVFCATEVEL